MLLEKNPPPHCVTLGINGRIKPPHMDKRWNCDVRQLKKPCVGGESRFEGSLIVSKRGFALLPSAKKDEVHVHSGLQ
jgi:hypothetical protein